MTAHLQAQSLDSGWPVKALSSESLSVETLESARVFTAEHAQETDSAPTDLASLLAHFGEQGLLGLDLDPNVEADPSSPKSPRSIAAAATFLDIIAGECMSSAFSLWAHRMVLEYLRDVEPQSTLGLARTQLLHGERFGSTAMAAALQESAGLGKIPVVATPDGDGWKISGVIRWASNLQAGGFIVLPARVGDGDQRIVVGLDLDRAGFTVHPSKELLALNSTFSGAVELHDVAVCADEVITSDVGAFLKRVRPVLLLLQSAFCVGLARRALQEAEPLVKGPAEVLRDNFTKIRADFDDIVTRVQHAQSNPAEISYRDVTQLRLDASHNAQKAVQLESTLMGGRGYQQANDSCRRLREAMFLPVQSPSEVQLLWELNH